MFAAKRETTSKFRQIEKVRMELGRRDIENWIGLHRSHHTTRLKSVIEIPARQGRISGQKLRDIHEDSIDGFAAPTGCSHG